MSQILLRADFVSVAGLISEATDAKTLSDFILRLLRQRCFSTGCADMSYRARRFMLKFIVNVPVIPPSLVVTGITMLPQPNYIGGGGFGRVYKGEWRGKVVALKVLYKSDNQVVRLSTSLYIAITDVNSTRSSVEKL